MMRTALDQDATGRIPVPKKTQFHVIDLDAQGNYSYSGIHLSELRLMLARIRGVFRKFAEGY